MDTPHANANGAAHENPFGKIVALETELNAETLAERASLEQARLEHAETVKAKKEATIESERAKAKAELVEYKDTVLPRLMKDETERSNAEAQRIDRETGKLVESAAENVFKKALSSNFFLSL